MPRPPLCFEGPTNLYTHLVVTWDKASGVGALYVNRTQLDSSATDGPFEPTGQKFEIGGAFIGFIDEVALYDRAMPAAEAVQLP